MEQIKQNKEKETVKFELSETEKAWVSNQPINSSSIEAKDEFVSWPQKQARKRRKQGGEYLESDVNLDGAGDE